MKSQIILFTYNTQNRFSVQLLQRACEAGLLADLGLGPVAHPVLQQLQLGGLLARRICICFSCRLSLRLRLLPLHLVDRAAQAHLQLARLDLRALEVVRSLLQLGSCLFLQLLMQQRLLLRQRRPPLLVRAVPEGLPVQLEPLQSLSLQR